MEIHRAAWPPARERELRERWAAGEKPRHIKAAMNLSEGQLRGRITRYNLQHRSANPRQPSQDHPAVIEGRTLYPKSVGLVGDVLKPGANQKKLGGKVQKGEWKGFPMYALTLEERATCPRSCLQWVSCYGNHMTWAKRMLQGDELEARIWLELASLQRRHPRGFVIRLHILGDFYSMRYVALWRSALNVFPALRVFGYTAHQRNTLMGDALHELRTAYWSRFSVRTSGARGNTGPRTIVIGELSDLYTTARKKENRAILCPAQTGKTASCSTCALCWSAPNKTIAFLRH